MPVADRLSGGSTAALHPDPLLSANVYASGSLDALLLGGVVPLWRRVADQVEAHGGYLWVVRYGRLGEHLKLRLHAPLELEESLRSATEAAISCALEALPQDVGERRARTEVPPIDAEDEGEQLHPDRTLVWTTYRRSFVSLGGEPWLDDDRYVAHETALLGAGFGLLAAAVAGVEGSEIPHRVRQTTLLKAVVSGVAALGFGERAGDYLAYHRDWLLRFFVRDPEREAAFLANLDERVAGMEATVERLRAAIEASRSPGGAAGGGAWETAARRLADYAAGFRGRPEYLTDPFAADPVYPGVFKAFHGTANQLGLPPMEEAFVHHLLWHASGAAKAEVAETVP